MRVEEVAPAADIDILAGLALGVRLVGIVNIEALTDTPCVGSVMVSVPASRAASMSWALPLSPSAAAASCSCCFSIDMKEALVTSAPSPVVSVSSDVSL